MTTVESLERDVLACGVPLGDTHGLVKRYERALRTGSGADWIELYVGTFVTLLRDAHRTCAADSGAANRLLRLLEDDLGMQLFDGDARARLHRSLLHKHAAFHHRGRARERVQVAVDVGTEQQQIGVLASFERAAVQSD